MSTTLGQLLIVLSAETSAFARGMTDARSLAFTTSGEIVDSLKRVSEEFGKMRFDSSGAFKRSAEVVGGVIAGIGVAVAASSVIVTKEVAEQVKQMSKLSQSYGLSIEEISQLRVASKLTGVDMETLTMGLGRMAKAAATAAEGGKMQAQAFSSLGVSVTDGAGHLRPMNDLLLDVAGRFSKLQDGTGKTALAMQLFGRSGAALIPFLDQGKAGIEEFQRIADRLGLTLSGPDAEAALHLQEHVELLDLAMDGFKQNLGLSVIPALNAVSTAFLQASSGGQNFAAIIGGSVGSAIIGTVNFLDVLLLKVAELEVLLSHLPGQSQQLVLLMEEMREERRFALSEGGMKVETVSLNPAVQKAMEQYREDLAKIRAEHDKGILSAKAYGDAETDAAQKYSAAYKKALATPFDLAGKDKTVPTFSPAAKKNPDAGLDELLNKAREAFNKGESNPLTTEISNIERIKQQLEAFRASHPETVFLELNSALEKLNKTEQDLVAKSQGELAGQLTAGVRNQGDAAMSLPVTPPSATGGVLQQRELYDLGNDINQQNRERAQIYQQTRTPLEQYEEQVARLNVLYKDHSTAEYARALADVKEKAVGAFDPTQKLEKQQQELNQEYAAGLVSANAYADASKKINLQLDQIALKTATAREGLQLFFKDTQLQAQSWGQLVYAATQKAFSGIQNSMSTAFNEMILGTKTVGQAFAQMGRDMLKAVISACTQMLAEWITTHLLMAAISKLFGTGDDGSDAHAAKVIASNVSIAQSNAGVAASEEFAWVLAETGNIWDALAMAAVADGVAQTFVVQASMAKGGLLPKDMIIQAHEGEAVLPNKLTGFLMNAANTFKTPQAGSGHLAFAGAGGGGGSAGSLRNGKGHTFNFNGLTDSALETRVRTIVRSEWKQNARKMGVK